MPAKPHMTTPVQSHILVADDDPDIRRLIARLLRAAGYAVSLATDGAEALRMAREETPDLLLLDVSMPGSDGYAVCREIQMENPVAPPVIFLTALTEMQDRVTGLDSGAVDYIVKPFAAADLAARVRAALRTKAERDVLAAAAATDPLTGLPNRRQLDVRAEEAIKHSQRHDRPLACLMIDVDHFKRVNDTFGHAAGDTVLRSVADRLRGFARASDVAARFGGEEFVLLLLETDEAEAMAVAERIRSALAGHGLPVRSSPGAGQPAAAVTAALQGAPQAAPRPSGLPTSREDEHQIKRPDSAPGGSQLPAIPVEQLTIPVSVSIGVACWAPGMSEPLALYAAADQALYAAKQLGRDRVVLASPAPS